MSEQNLRVPTAPRPGQRGPVSRVLRGSVGRNLGLVIALGALFAVGAITAGVRFTNFDNVLTIIRFASITGVLIRQCSASVIRSFCP